MSNKHLLTKRISNHLLKNNGLGRFKVTKRGANTILIRHNSEYARSIQIRYDLPSGYLIVYNLDRYGDPIQPAKNSLRNLQELKQFLDYIIIDWSLRAKR